MTDDDWKDDIMAETYGPASDANVAQTPLADLVANALERMEAGARMILDSIPGDSSLSSSSHSQDVTREIARLCRIGASVMPRPRLSMEMLASLEETWEAMEAVGEDPKDAAALRALLDWHYNFSTPQVKP